MTIEVEEGPWDQSNDDLDTIVQLQNLLLKAVEGARGGEIDHEYQAIRKAILAEPTYHDLVPRFIRTNRDLDSMWPFFKSFNSQWEPRRKMVREELLPLMDKAEESTFPPKQPENSSSSWTGIQTTRQRLIAIQTLAPTTMASIETLILSLETPNHNGAPPMDEHKNAIENLRSLHQNLGELLDLADEKRLNSELGNGLLVEAAKYGKRAARELRNDPMPYAMSAMLLATLTAFGAPGIAGYMVGVAMNIRKTTPSQ